MLREDERDGADSPPDCLGSKYSSGKLFGSPALQWTLLGLHSSFFPLSAQTERLNGPLFFFSFWMSFRNTFLFSFFF